MGDPIPMAKADVEQKLERENGVVSAHVQGYCCVGDGVVLYLGLLEVGARPFGLHSPPAEDLQLPLKLDLVYQRLVRALEGAHERGLLKETYDKGYPLSEDPEARRAQETLTLLVDPLVDDVGQVLRRAADEQARIAAAYILAYTKERDAAESHLQYALRDFDPDVRQNAIRSLEFIRRSKIANPPPPPLDFGDGTPMPPKDAPVISPTWFVEMLHSVEFADRVEAANMLVRLTEARQASVLSSLEERSLSELGQMASWTVPEHAESAYILLGRIAGVPESDILTSFRNHQRNVVTDVIRQRAAAKKRFIFF